MNGLILTQILIDGLIISVVVNAIILGAMLLNPRIMLSDYPPEIQAHVPPMTKPEKQQQAVLGVFFIGATLVGLFYSNWQLVGRSGEVAFLPLFLNTYFVFVFCNLWDLLVLDYFVLIVLKPKALFVDGIEQYAHYNNFTYHFRGFLKGLIIGLVLSLIVSLISTLIFPLLLH